MPDEDASTHLKNNYVAARGIGSVPESGAVALSATSEPAELSYDGKYLVTTLEPGYRMLLIGPGQLAEYLPTMALFNGFEVTVCDPRPEYRQKWKVAGVKLVTEMPDDTVVDFAPDIRSCAVALTHDLKLDDLALMEALHSEASYVGAIGSRRNSANRRTRLIGLFWGNRGVVRAAAWSHRGLHRKQGAYRDRRKHYGGGAGD